MLSIPKLHLSTVMTMTLTSLLIRPIRSIQRTDTFIHDVTSSFHPTIASYYSDGDRLHFCHNKHVCSENKHPGQTQGNVQVNTSFFKREPQGKYESTLTFTKRIRFFLDIFCNTQNNAIKSCSQRNLGAGKHTYLGSKNKYILILFSFFCPTVNFPLLSFFIHYNIILS